MPGTIWPIVCDECHTIIPRPGESICHCASCHQTFSSLQAFDTHRAGDSCKPPVAQDEGLTKAGRPKSSWSIEHRTDDYKGEPVTFDLWHHDVYRTPEQWAQARADKQERARERAARLGFGRRTSNG